MTYREWVEDEAARLGSDGCTMALGLKVFCCKEHDVLWRTRKHRDGTPCSEDEANARFRSCLMRSSRFGWFSPMAWWRWCAVKFGGQHPTPPAEGRLAPPDASARAARERIIAELEGTHGRR
jgi:hypothetical protein